MKTPVLCWLLAALLIGLTGLLRNAALPVAGLCALLTLAALGVLAVMPGMRRKAMAVSIEHLVSLSLMRLWGLYLIWLDRRGLIASDMALLWKKESVRLAARSRIPKSKHSRRSINEYTCITGTALR